jgi:hypothetical protein
MNIGANTMMSHDEGSGLRKEKACEKGIVPFFD